MSLKLRSKFHVDGPASKAGAPVVSASLVISGCHAPTLFDFFGEPFDQVTRGLKQIGSLRFRLGGMLAHDPMF
jgi:hypothetical protein